MLASRTPRRFLVTCFLLYFLLALTLQILAGAFTAELSGYPDEPAHYVTTLMVYNFLRDVSLSPIEFAQAYYFHYPKVAIGHWPPFFYALNAVWGLIVGPSPQAMLVLQAILAALIATAIAAFCDVAASWAMGLFGGGLFLFLAVIRANTGQIMTENLVCLCAFLTCVYFGRFLVSHSSRHLILSVLACLIAMMTHPSGLFLVFVYIVTILITRRFDLLRRRLLWLSAAAGASVVVPWYVIMFRITRNGIFQGGAHFAAQEFPRVIRLYPQVAGPGLLALALAGALWVGLCIIRRSPEVKPLHVSYVSLFALPCIFYPLVPAGFEPRRLTMVIPAMVCLAVLTCRALGGVLPKTPGFRYIRPEILFVFIVLLFQGNSFTAYHKPRWGYREMVCTILSDPQLSTAHFLLSADGDGVVIAEMAAREPISGRFVMRARKVFARSDWSGRDYTLLYHTPEEAMSVIERSPTNALLIDAEDPATAPPHHALLWKVIERYPSRWKLLYHFPLDPPMEHKEVFVYLLDDGRRRPNSSVTLHLEPMLGNTLDMVEK